MYKKLQALQGSFIPTYYGMARWYSCRALILSDVQGIRPHEQGPIPLDVEEFEDRLEPLINTLSLYNLGYRDLRLSKFLITERGLVVTDLAELEYIEEWEKDFRVAVQMDQLMEEYRAYLADPVYYREVSRLRRY